MLTHLRGGSGLRRFASRQLIAEQAIGDVVLVDVADVATVSTPIRSEATRSTSSAGWARQSSTGQPPVWPPRSRVEPLHFHWAGQGSRRDEPSDNAATSAGERAERLHRGDCR